MDHPSYKRLMAAALAATEASAQPVRSLSELARGMNESPQRVHNWKVRGVSKEGALKAEFLYGVSANHILDGIELPPTSQASEPPLPPRDYSDRLQVSETDFGLLQDVRLVMSEEELQNLRARAERTRRIAFEQVEEVAGRAGGARAGDTWRRPGRDAGDNFLGGESGLGGLDEIPPAKKGGKQ